MRSLEQLLSDIYRALGDKEFQEGVERAVGAATTALQRILEEHPEVASMAERVRETRRKVLENIEYYVDRAMKSVEKVGGHAYLAGSAEDARRIIGGIIGSGKIVVFSKSLTAFEIGLREYLEGLGNEVWETDLGELIIQLAGERPMHAVVPALHMTRSRVERLLRKAGILGGKARRVEDMVLAVRRFLREKFCSADYGVSSANAVASDTGAVFLVENEGNIRLVTGLPPVHIAIVGVEKIAPTMEDAYRQVLVQAAYAGLYPPTYIDVLAGPSSTADIEYVRVYGAHGPRELHVVFLDNGRLKASRNTELSEQLLCIRCGRCQVSCPIWMQAANLWGSGAYGGPMGVGWTAITRSTEEASRLAMLCLGCYACQEACPMNISLVDIIRSLKTRYSRH